VVSALLRCERVQQQAKRNNNKNNNRGGTTTRGPNWSPLVRLQPLLESLQSDLRLGFLDDFTLWGLADMVAADIAEIVRLGGSMCLIRPSLK